MDLKKVLASSCRQKILIVLSSYKEMRIMQLVYKVHSTYYEVNRNLKILEEEGVIISAYRKQVKHGQIRVILINSENPKTKKLLQALKELGN